MRENQVKENLHSESFHSVRVQAQNSDPFNKLIALQYFQVRFQLSGNQLVYKDYFGNNHTIFDTY